MIRCRQCNTAMIGHAVKSGKFFYYMCGNARRKGRGICQTPLLPKRKIEAYVIDRIRQCILTEENLEELVRLTNEELSQSSSAERERLDVLEAQLGDVDSRLAKLYDALETGEFKGGELAPRIKTLYEKTEELLRARTDAQEALSRHTIELADPRAVKEYVEDLRSLLETSGVVEQNPFLRSFVERIEVGQSDINLIYTLPVPGVASPTAGVGVLPFVHDGPP